MRGSPPRWSAPAASDNWRTTSRPWPPGPSPMTSWPPLSATSASSSSAVTACSATTWGSTGSTSGRAWAAGRSESPGGAGRDPTARSPVVDGAVLEPVERQVGRHPQRYEVAARAGDEHLGGADGRGGSDAGYGFSLVHARDSRTTATPWAGTPTSPSAVAPVSRSMPKAGRRTASAGWLLTKRNVRAGGRPQGAADGREARGVERVHHGAEVRVGCR